MYKKVLKSISHRKVQIKMTMRYYYTLIRMATIEDISSVQSLSHVRLFATPWPADHQASLSITNSQSLFKPMSIELVMLSKHLILGCPLLLLPSIFPKIRVFLMSQFFTSGGQSIGASISASVLLMNIQDWFPPGLTNWLSMQSKGLSRVLYNTTIQNTSILQCSAFFIVQFSHPYMTTGKNHSFD